MALIRADAQGSCPPGLRRDEFGVCCPPGTKSDGIAGCLPVVQGVGEASCFFGIQQRIARSNMVVGQIVRAIRAALEPEIRKGALSAAAFGAAADEWADILSEEIKKAGGRRRADGTWIWPAGVSPESWQPDDSAINRMASFMGRAVVEPWRVQVEAELKKLPIFQAIHEDASARAALKECCDRIKRSGASLPAGDFWVGNVLVRGGFRTVNDWCRNPTTYAQRARELIQGYENSGLMPKVPPLNVGEGGGKLKVGWLWLGRAARKGHPKAQALINEVRSIYESAIQRIVKAASESGLPKEMVEMIRGRVAPPSPQRSLFEGLITLRLPEISLNGMGTPIGGRPTTALTSPSPSGNVASADADGATRGPKLMQLLQGLDSGWSVQGGGQVLSPASISPEVMRAEARLASLWSEIWPRLSQAFDRAVSIEGPALKGQNPWSEGGLPSYNEVQDARRAAIQAFREVLSAGGGPQALQAFVDKLNDALSLISKLEGGLVSRNYLLASKATDALIEKGYIAAALRVLQGASPVAEHLAARSKQLLLQAGLAVRMQGLRPGGPAQASLSAPKSALERLGKLIALVEVMPSMRGELNFKAKIFMNQTETALSFFRSGYGVLPRLQSLAGELRALASKLGLAGALEEAVQRAKAEFQSAPSPSPSPSPLTSPSQAPLASAGAGGSSQHPQSRPQPQVQTQVQAQGMSQSQAQAQEGQALAPSIWEGGETGLRSWLPAVGLGLVGLILLREVIR